MHIHIKRKHIGRNPELAPKIGSSSFPNSVQQPSFYAYKTLNHSDTIADEIKNTEAIFDKHLENICRINEANRMSLDKTQQPIRASMKSPNHYFFKQLLICFRAVAAVAA